MLSSTNLKRHSNINFSQILYQILVAGKQGNSSGFWESEKQDFFKHKSCNYLTLSQEKKTENPAQIGTLCEQTDRQTHTHTHTHIQTYRQTDRLKVELD